MTHMEDSINIDDLKAWIRKYFIIEFLLNLLIIIIIGIKDIEFISITIHIENQELTEKFIIVDVIKIKIE